MRVLRIKATLADRLGYDAVAITDHHFMNCMMMPAPLQFALKIAAHTEQLKIITAISILPICDMRISAGEHECSAPIATMCNPVCICVHAWALNTSLWKPLHHAKASSRRSVSSWRRLLE